MKHILLGGLLTLVLAVGSTGAEEPKSPSSSSPDPAPEKPNYLTSGDVVGQIVKVDDKSLTLRVTWYTQTPPKNNNNRNMHGNWNRGTSGRNPQQMYMHMMQMQQQMMQQMVQAQTKAANTKPTENHQDYVMNFTTDAQARILHLPPKLDDNGKKSSYSANELQKLKGNTGVKGYQAELSQLKAGQIVEAHVVHLPKQKDNLVRWALILDEPKAPNAAPGSGNPANKK